MLGTEILVGVLGNAVYDLVKQLIRDLIGYEDNPIADKMFAVCDKATAKYFEKYGDEYGDSSCSFLARQSNWDAVLRSIYYSSDDITTDAINPEGYSGLVAPTEAVEFFLQSLKDELANDFLLDKIITEKKHIKDTQELQLLSQETIDQAVAIKQDTTSIKDDTSVILEQLTQLQQQLLMPKQDEILSSEYESELEYCKELLDAGKSHEAIKFLNRLKDRSWEKSTDKIKYHILTYLGSAKYSLHLHTEAGNHLIEALKYKSTDKDAIYNAAVGHHLLHQCEVARDLLQNILSSDPDNARAYSLLVQISESSKSIPELVDQIPEALRVSTEVAFSLGLAARDRGEIDQAKHWLTTAVSSDIASWIEPKAALGSLLVDQSLSEERLLYIRQISGKKREELQYGIDLLTVAWDKVKHTDLAVAKVNWIYNRAIGKFLLGDFSEADNDIQTALSYQPNDVIFLKFAARVAFVKKDHSKAIGELEKIKDDRNMPEVRILIAECYWSLGNDLSAKEILENVLKTDVNEDIVALARRLLIEIYLSEKNFEIATAHAEALASIDPNRILFLSEKAKVLREKGDIEAAKLVLDEAIKDIAIEKSVLDINVLAEELFKLGEYEHAIVAYQKFVDESVYTPLTVRLITSYYKSGNISKTNTLCSNLLDKYGPLPYVSELASLISEMIGDLDKAKHICEEYLKNTPDDLGVQLRLANINMRIPDFASVDKFLNTVKSFTEMDNSKGVLLAHLYVARGNYRKAIELLYNLRKRHFSDGEIHYHYVNVFFRSTKGKEKWLSPKQVALDTAVNIIDESGKCSCYKIEDGPDIDLQKNEISPVSVLAKKMFGKIVGDTIVLNENPDSPEIGTIKEIKSKYVYALHESLPLLDRIFPEIDKIKGFKMRSINNKIQEQDLQVILNMVDRRQSSIQEITDLYKDGKLTLGGIADLTSDDIIDAWSGVISKSEIGLRCCTGSGIELENNYSILDRKPKVIIDLVALLTLHSINLKDEVHQYLGNFAIAQTTLDHLHKKIMELGLQGSKGYTTIHKEGDSYIRTEITRESIEKNKSWLNNLLEWTEANCEVLPASESLSMNLATKEMFDNLIGAHSIDSIMISTQAGSILYTDDLLLRKLSKTDFNVDGTWTQAALAWALKSKLIDEAIFQEATVKLVQLNYKFTYISVETLVKASEMAEWNSSPYLVSVLDVLSECDEESVVRISGEFLIEIWRQPIEEQQRIAITNMLFNKVLGSKHYLISSLRVHLEDKLLFRPYTKGQVMLLLNAFQ